MRPMWLVVSGLIAAVNGACAITSGAPAGGSNQGTEAARPASPTPPLPPDTQPGPVTPGTTVPPPAPSTPTEPPVPNTPAAPQAFPPPAPATQPTLAECAWISDKNACDHVPSCTWIQAAFCPESDPLAGAPLDGSGCYLKEATECQDDAGCPKPYRCLVVQGSKCYPYQRRCESKANCLGGEECINIPGEANLCGIPTRRACGILRGSDAYCSHFSNQSACSNDSGSACVWEKLGAACGDKNDNEEKRCLPRNDCLNDA